MQTNTLVLSFGYSFPVKNGIFDTKYGYCKPRIFVKYKREYWISPCKNFRATIDKNIEYKNIKSLNVLNRGIEADLNVLEFKYLDTMDSKFRIMIGKTDFPFRMTKNSKYVSAVINLNSSFAIGAAALLPEPPCSTIILKAYLGFM